MIGIALLVATVDTPLALTVDEVVARHRELAGQAVAITGWLSKCGRYSCAIFPARSSANAREWSGPLISIGNGRALEPELQRLSGSQVTLTAVVTSNCWGADDTKDTIVVCTDRADQLNPIAVVPTAPRAKKPE